MRRIAITPYGNIGNQMFQYMTALALQERVPSAVISGMRMPAWELDDSDTPAGAPNRLFVGFRRHQIPFEEIVALLAADSRIDVHVDGVSCRLEYWGHLRDRLQTVFPPDPAVRGGTAEEIVINVRAAEILRGVHGNYVPTPIELHEELVSELGLQPVFVGQLSPNVYTDELRQRFPQARFVSHDSELGDFQYLRASVNLVPAVSTYSWLAAWLSRSAKRIYLPVMGLYNPRARQDVDLLPHDDPRYVFLDSDVLEWTPHDGGLERLLHGSAADFGFDVRGALATPGPRRWGRRN